MSFAKNTVSKVGAGLVVSNLLVPIPSIIIYSLVASIVGDERLEGSDGLHWYGQVLFWLPGITGVLVFLYGQFIYRGSEDNRPFSRATTLWLLAALGITMLVTGISNIVQAGNDRDPQIGTGVLVLGGLLFFVISASLLALNKVKSKRSIRRDSEEEE